MRNEAVYRLSKLINTEIRYVYDEQLVNIVNIIKRFLEGENLVFITDENVLNSYIKNKYKHETFIVSKVYNERQFADTFKFNTSFRNLVNNLKKKIKEDIDVKTFANISLINKYVMNVSGYTSNLKDVFHKIENLFKYRRPILMSREKFFEELKGYTNTHFFIQEFNFDFINSPLKDFRWLILVEGGNKLEHITFENLKYFDTVFIVCGNHFHKIHEFEIRRTIKLLIREVEVKSINYAIAGKKGIIMLQGNVAYQFLLPVSLMILSVQQ